MKILTKNITKQIIFQKQKNKHKIFKKAQTKIYSSSIMLVLSAVFLIYIVDYQNQRHSQLLSMQKAKKKVKVKTKASRLNVNTTRSVTGKKSKETLPQKLLGHFSFQMRASNPKCTMNNKRRIVSQMSNSIKVSNNIKSNMFQPFRSLAQNQFKENHKISKNLMEDTSISLQNITQGNFLQKFSLNEFFDKYIHKNSRFSDRYSNQIETQKSLLVELLKKYLKEFQYKCQEKLNYAHIVEQRVQQYEMQKDLFKNVRNRSKQI